MRKLFIISLILSGVLSSAHGQKVGLVLSGGGARGLAHIGVIKVLEANNIPIDYITGTSMGAIIGGLYAAGYTTAEMETLFRSDEFYFWSTGKIQEEYRYFFKQPEENPGWIDLKLQRRENKVKILPPTNIIPQWQMDFTFMEMMAATTAVSGGDFNKLFVPFRCIATEVHRNKQVILAKGDVGEAIRASMTFPLFFKPIKINGELLFDGGIVNNFPHDVMKETFKPDIIIGSKVVPDPKTAEADDIIQQITNMVQRPTDYDLTPEDGIMLETDVQQVGLLDFPKLDFVVEAGQKTTEALIDSIKKRIPRRVDPEELARKRESFQARKPALLFQNIQVEGVEDPLQRKYIINSIKHNKNVFTVEVFKKEYFKLIADEQIRSIRPIAMFNNESGYFDVHLIVEPETRGEITIGGNISTKPINQGFASFEYRLFKNRSYTLYSNLYFGRFYSSFKAGTRIDVPSFRPYYLAGYLTYNRWDFFSSSNELFFEDVRPPYIIQNETNFRGEIGFPWKRHDKFSLGVAGSWARDSYYQIEKFTKADQPDKTDFNAVIVTGDYEKNSLNQKQYATEGFYNAYSLQYIAGAEKIIPGTTLGGQVASKHYHSYVMAKTSLERYFRVNRRLGGGFRFDGVLSTKKDFQNYTSTMLAAPGFYPTPHSKALFVENFHAPNFVAGGLKALYIFNGDMHFRIEGYGFLPFFQTLRGPDYKAVRSDEFFGKVSFQGLAALVYQTGVGPASLALNYYDKRGTQWFLMFNFGYTLFNKRGL
ncbi:MAG: patatin-like phospholipase family protein [Bacteroidota bacterium]|nr:patatin-like phospholipase family protein [Prolixibacteraceae bacterium]MDI9563217.1 patatin-like phospholipase family protein [Bacteroidota bacterium]OQB81133.1 MAG: NTE family protein RssA [Bacteroidetes bacterium ADurb.Bin123]HNZ68556.1 patatin-like phospholipase family protein [Prolixibacteraceae bacterium]HOC86122.1 patatin-like phospholipase family protein [Prolixibacteraceae bacterium]